MRTLHYFSDANKKYRIAYETQEIYAPLAQRLGIKEWQDELEDYAFKIVNPEIRKSIKERLNYLNKKDETIIDDIKQSLEKLLTKEGIDSNIEGRLKNPYSIWLKIPYESEGKYAGNFEFTYNSAEGMPRSEIIRPTKQISKSSGF